MGKLAAIVAVLALVVGLWFGATCLVQFAWNEAVAVAFKAPTLTFWQTAGCMLVLGVVTNALRGGYTRGQ